MQEEEAEARSLVGGIGLVYLTATVDGICSIIFNIGYFFTISLLSSVKNWNAISVRGTKSLIVDLQCHICGYGTKQFCASCHLPVCEGCDMVISHPDGSGRILRLCDDCFYDCHGWFPVDEGDAPENRSRRLGRRLHGADTIGPVEEASQT